MSDPTAAEFKERLECRARHDKELEEHDRQRLEIQARHAAERNEMIERHLAAKKEREASNTR